MKQILTILLFSFLSTYTSHSMAASLYGKMQKGGELYEQEKYDESLQTFVDAQVESPEDPKLKYNIASTHYKMRNFEEAVKGYLDVAATARDARIEEQALYNIGNAKYRQGKLEEAVEYYKKALELDPEDKDAQHNLEFVREEIKRRLNEAKETAQQQQQQQQQQKQEDQGQCQTGQAGQQQEQQSEQQQQEQNGQEGEQQQTQTAQQQQQQQQQAGETKEQEQDTDAAGTPMQAKKMTEEEAQQWLNSIQEDRDKFKEKQQKAAKGRMPRRSGKDW